MSNSVEWLFHKLWETPKDKLNWNAILQQAKEMHKEEIEDVELRAKEIIIIKHTEHSTPIELPTDEEIEEMVHYNPNFSHIAFGVKWLRDLIIKVGNK